MTSLDLSPCSQTVIDRHFLAQTKDTPVDHVRPSIFKMTTLWCLGIAQYRHCFYTLWHVLMTLGELNRDIVRYLNTV